MNRQPISRGRRDNELNIRDRYGQAYKKFISGQFTYNSHCLLRKLCETGQKQPNMQGVPLYRIMIQICKIMMMNELQILFFGATVQQMNWKVIQKCLEVYIQDVTDITPKVQKDSYVKKMQLSLLLIAYIVKIYLNDQSALYDFKIRDLIKKDFDKMYQEWVTKVQNNFKFSPKHMNKLFKDLDKGKINHKQKIIDYNTLVHDLFKNNFEQERVNHQQTKQYNPINYKNRNVQKEQVFKSQYYPIQKRQNNKSEHINSYQQDKEYSIPVLVGPMPSNKSQISMLGYSKKQSNYELFEKGQLKPDQPFLEPNASKEFDF